MGIQKNFVVKNGIEVNTNLIYADKDLNKVGIGTTIVNDKLQVKGGVSADNLNISGFGTIPQFFGDNVNLSQNLKVSGISTFDGVKVSSGIVTSSVVTPVVYYGDGSHLTGILTSVEIKSNGNTVGYAKVLDISTNLTVFTSNSGIATLTASGGGGGNSIYAARTKDSKTASNNQRIFYTNYFVGYVDVYVNGVRLDESEYIASNGISIILDTPCSAGDIVDIVSYNPTSSNVSSKYAYTERVGFSTTASLNQTVVTTTYFTDSVDIFVNGVRLSNAEYTAVDGNTVTLSVPCYGGEQINVISYNSDPINLGNSYLYTSRTNFNFTATENQTSFNAVYSIGSLDVFVNGVRLNDAEYTATDGFFVELNAPCFGGEEVSIISYNLNLTGTYWFKTQDGIYTNENVGVGTTNTEDYKLNIQGDLNFTGTLYKDGVPFSGAAGESYWVANNAGIHTFVNVGIGTTNPPVKLYVDGDARVTGVLTVGNASITIDGNTNKITSTNGEIGISSVGVDTSAWILTYGDVGIDTTTQYFSSVAFDSEGNIYSTGTGNPYPYYGDTSSPYLIKFSNDGNILWQKFFEYDGESYINATCESLHVDKNTNEVYVLIYNDYFAYADVVKLNSSGDIIWKTRIGGGDINACDLIVDSSSNVYVVGTRYGNYGYNSKAFIIKIDSSSNILWQKEIEASGYYYARFVSGQGIAVDSLNNLYVVGSYAAQSSSYSYQLFLYKFDSDGNLVWEREVTDNNYSEGYGVGVDYLDNVYLVGSVSNDYNQTYYDDYPLLVIKLDSDGNLIYKKIIDSFGLIQGAYAVKADSNDNIYITGSMQPSYYYYTESQIVIISLDASGYINWSKRIVDVYNNTTKQWYNMGHKLIDINDTEIVVGGYLYGTSTYEYDGLLFKMPNTGENVNGIYRKTSKNLIAFKIEDFNPVGYWYEYSGLSTSASIGVTSSVLGISTSGITTGTDANYTEYLIYKSSTSLSIEGDLVTNNIHAFDFNINDLPFGKSCGYLSNLFVGEYAGSYNVTGHDNTFIGYCAGKYNTTGSHNNFLSAYSGSYNTVGSYNNFFGYSAGCCNVDGSYNNAFGYYANTYNTTGCYNNFFGYEAGYYNTSGSYNNAFGVYAGYCNNVGSYNNFFGYGAGSYNTCGNYNNFFGYYAGAYNCGGYNNNFVGTYSGCNNTSGCYNNFFGRYSGCNTTTGSYNVAIGDYASGPTTGSGNFLGGYSAGWYCMNDSSYNNFIGWYAGGYRDQGDSYCNNFMGYYAGARNCNSYNNNFFGSCSGYFNTGCYNNFFGHRAGYCNTSGSNNIFLGNNAGCSNQTGSENVVIGYNADLPILNGSNQFVIGAGSTNWIVGDSSYNLGIGTTNPTTKLDVIGGARVTESITIGNTSTSSHMIIDPVTNSIKSGTGEIGISSAVVDTSRWGLMYGDFLNNSEQNFPSVAYDSDGNIYAVGTGQVSWSEKYPYLIKFSTTGEVLWQKFFTYDIGIQDAICESLCVDKLTNQIYIGISNYTDNTSDIIKLNSSGDIIWTKKIGPSFASFDIATDHSSNIYLIGSKNYGYDYLSYIVKLDSDGNQLWQKVLEAVNGNYYYKMVLSQGIAFDSLNNIYVTGQYNDSVGGYFNFLFLMKFDSDGNLLWERAINQYEFAAGFTITIDSNDNPYVVGSIYANNNYYNFYAIKFDSNGNQSWQKILSNNGNEEFAYSAKVEGDYLYTAGRVNDQIIITVLDLYGSLISQKRIVKLSGSYWPPFLNFGHKILDVKSDELIVSGYIYGYNTRYNGLLVKLPIDLNNVDGIYRGDVGSQDAFKIENFYSDYSSGSATISSTTYVGYTTSTLGISTSGITTAPSLQYAPKVIYKTPVSLNIKGNLTASSIDAFDFNINGLPLSRSSGYSDNFFVGKYAGTYNTSGEGNNFIGYFAGNYNTTGSCNNFLSAYAGCCNTIGSYNNFFGYGAGAYNNSGCNNNFFGNYAGHYNASGCYNNFMGYYAGCCNTTGSNNIFFGKNAGKYNQTGSQNIVIGNDRDTPILNGSNQLVIGAGSTNWIVGNSSYNVGIGTTNPTTRLSVGGTITANTVIATNGFVSVGNTTPIQITLVGNTLTFTAVGIGSTTLTLS